MLVLPDTWLAGTVALPVIVLTEPSDRVETIVVGTTAEPALGVDVAAVERPEDAEADAADDADALWLAEACCEALVAEVAEVTSVLEVAVVALVTSLLVVGWVVVCADVVSVVDSGAVVVKAVDDGRAVVEDIVLP